MCVRSVSGSAFVPVKQVNCVPQPQRAALLAAAVPRYAAQCDACELKASYTSSLRPHTLVAEGRIH
jgi:hypothetical protein